MRENRLPPYHRKRRNLRLVSIPERCHPLVKAAFTAIRIRKARLDDIADVSGVRKASVKAWRKRTNPSITSIEAVLAALGFRLIPCPAPDRIPPELATELAAITERFKLAGMEELLALLG